MAILTGASIREFIKNTGSSSLSSIRVRRPITGRSNASRGQLSKRIPSGDQQEDRKKSKNKLHVETETGRRNPLE